MKSEAGYREKLDVGSPISQWWARRQLGKLGITILNPNSRYIPARHLYPVPAEFEMPVDPSLLSDEPLPEDIQAILNGIQASFEAERSRE
ncbi:hypothetical protein EYC59_00065 [Candidatus Saccharibacteria bacterium]|nr:MAG: hypothetical protein EYC59_00065 [Candidatus Saccharibacteria bacterium]